MNVGIQIPQYEKAQNIPNGTTYIADMGDGSGTKGIKQEVLSERVGEDLKIGDLENLQTTNKTSIVEAINEAAQSGGGSSSVDILDSKEEIEANTQSGKAAGALAVQEMFSDINSNLNGCSFEQEGEDFYIVGADSVRKKLGSPTVSDLKIQSKTNTLAFNGGSGTYSATMYVETGLVLYKNLFPVITTVQVPASSAYNYTHTFSFSYNSTTGVLTVSRSSNGNMTGNSSARVIVYYFLTT